jgi:hypothetical protein
MELRLNEVITPRELPQFVSFPYSLFRKSAYRVPLLRSDEFLSLRKDKSPAINFCNAILIQEMKKVFIKTESRKLRQTGNWRVTLRFGHNGNFINLDRIKEEDVIKKN